MLGSPRRPIGVTLAVLALGSLGACSASGSGSAAPTASVTGGGQSPSAASPGSSFPSSSPSGATGASPTTASPNTASPGAAFRLTSSAFADGAAIPRQYTCDGPDVSPPLAWDGAPAAAKALVLIVDDPDARGFIHWVAFDIPATTSGQLPEGVSKSRYPPRQGKNGFGRTGWGGPCPPSGTHHYRFRLIAVSQELGLPGTPTAGQALKATEGKMVAETTLVGVYRRG